LTELTVINGDTKAFVIFPTNGKYMTSNYFVISMSETKRVTAKGIPHCSCKAIITPKAQNVFHVKVWNHNPVIWLHSTQLYTL